MSTLHNDTWAEEAWINFQAALEDDDRQMAEAIMADAQDAGFKILTDAMATKLADYDLLKE